MKNITYYLARILSVIIVGFFALFILEGFGPGFGWQDSLSHLIPALVILGATIVAWKKPIIGSWFFMILGLYFLTSFILDGDYWNGILIGGIPLITGVMFLLEGMKKAAK